MATDRWRELEGLAALARGFDAYCTMQDARRVKRLPYAAPGLVAHYVAEARALWREALRCHRAARADLNR